jgi:hypothetical protein
VPSIGSETEELRVRTEICWRGGRALKPVAAPLDILTVEAILASFEPSEAAIGANSLARVHAHALHHAIHELDAIMIPNKGRVIVNSAHMLLLNNAI